MVDPFQRDHLLSHEHLWIQRRGKNLYLVFVRNNLQLKSVDFCESFVLPITVPGIGAPTSFLFPFAAFGWMCNSWIEKKKKEMRFDEKNSEF